MMRTDILNRLVDQCRYKTYLEIGMRDGRNFKAVKIKDVDKIAVDPAAEGPCLRMTSDEFFAVNKKKFDLIFVDGLHHQDQVYRDILNALKVLNPGGTIVCHDVNPSTCEEQLVPRSRQIVWTGDGWKAWVRLRMERSDLDMKVVNTDYGCGIIQRGSQPLLTGLPPLEWNEFARHRKKWLNLISEKKFIRFSKRWRHHLRLIANLFRKRA